MGGRTCARTDVGTDDYTVREGKKMGYVIKITKQFPCEGLFFPACFFLFLTTTTFGSDQPLLLHNNTHTHTYIRTRLRIPEIHLQLVNH